MSCRPFPGCMVRVIAKKSGKYGQKGGVVGMTDDGDYVVEIGETNHIFAEEDLSTKMDILKRKRMPEKEPPLILFDKFKQSIREGDTLLYAKKCEIDVGVVEKLIYFNKRPAAQCIRPDGSMVKWSSNESMMRIVPAMLPAAVRQELGIEGGESHGQNRPMEKDYEKVYH